MDNLAGGRKMSLGTRRSILMSEDLGQRGRLLMS